MALWGLTSIYISDVTIVFPEQLICVYLITESCNWHVSARICLSQMALPLWFLVCSVLCRVFLKLVQVHFGAQMTGKSIPQEWWRALWIPGSCCFEVVSSWPGFCLSPRKDCRLCGCVTGFLILGRFLVFGFLGFPPLKTLQMCC